MVNSTHLKIYGAFSVRCQKTVSQFVISFLGLQTIKRNMEVTIQHLKPMDNRL